MLKKGNEKITFIFFPLTTFVYPEMHIITDISGIKKNYCG